MATKILKVLTDKAALVNPPAMAARIVKSIATPQQITLSHIIRQEKAR